MSGLLRETIETVFQDSLQVTHEYQNFLHWLRSIAITTSHHRLEASLFMAASYARVLEEIKSMHGRRWKLNGRDEDVMKWFRISEVQRAPSDNRFS